MSTHITVRVSDAAIQSALLRLHDAARAQAAGNAGTAADLALVAVSDLFGAAAAVAVMGEVEDAAA